MLLKKNEKIRYSWHRRHRKHRKMTSFHVQAKIVKMSSLVELSPFVDEGELVPKGCIRRKFYQLFCGETEKIIGEINKELAA